MRLKALDLAIVLAAAGAIAYSAAAVYGPGKGRLEAAITGPGGEYFYPLSADRDIPIAGPLGDTIVEIRGGRVRIEDSPCPNKTCVAMGSIAQPGQWIACLPNRIFVRVEGGGGNAGVDASVY